MARERGRCFGGTRLYCPRPYCRGSKYSIISAISSTSIVASLYCEGSIDGELYAGFIEKCLAPELTSAHKVILDNVAFHKVKEAEDLIRATGAEIIYLPPYSPDLSPIELMWSKIKSVLKKYAARTAESFLQAIKAGFESVTVDDLTHWFRHCGYRIK